MNDLPDIDEENAKLKNQIQELPDINEENAKLLASNDELPDINIENAQLSKTSEQLPDINVENAKLSTTNAKLSTTNTELPDINSENAKLTPTDQQQTTVDDGKNTPDTHWQEVDERNRNNVGDRLNYAITQTIEDVKAGAKGAWDVVSSVANPIAKLAGDVLQGAGNLTQHGLVMPNGIAIGERGELGGNKLTPDELALRRRNNIGTIVGEKVNAGIDAIFPNEPNDNPVTAAIQKVGQEVGGLVRFTLGKAATLGAAEYGQTWNADFDAYVKAGKSPTEAAMWADFGGITNAIFAMALKGVPVSHYVKKMFGWELPENLLKTAVEKAGTLAEKDVKTEITRILANQFLKNAATEAAVLGGVSAAQTGATGAIQQLGTTGEINAGELGQAMLQSGTHGALTGAVMGALPAVPKITEARNGATEPIRNMQEAQAMVNRAKLTPEQESTLNMRIPEFTGEDTDMQVKVRERIVRKMTDEAVNGTPKDANGNEQTPLRERLNDPAEMETEIMKATEEVLFENNTAEIAKNVNTSTLGMKAGETAAKLASKMTRTADATECRIAGLIARENPDMDADRVWTVAEHLAAKGFNEKIILTKDRVETIEKEMASNAAETVPVEQPDGSLKTVSEMEAETAREERKAGIVQPTVETAPATAPDGTLEMAKKPIDRSIEWTPVEGKDNVWHTPEFPDVEIGLEDASTEAGTNADGTPRKRMILDNLPNPDTLDDAGKMKLGKFLIEQKDLAEKMGIDDVVVSEDPEMASKYGELVDTYKDTVREEKFKVRADGVVDVLKKSGLQSEVVDTEAEFNAKLAEFGDRGQKLIADGMTYGFTDGEKVYINPKFFSTRRGLDTPIHEFGHLAIIATKQINRPLYDRALELIKQTDYWNELNDRERAPDYVDLVDEKKGQEALTRMIADRGQRLEATTPKGVIDELKKILVEIWKSFGNALGIRDLTPERIEKMSIEDIADAIRAEMTSGREFGTRELSLQEGDLKTKILRFAKYSKPTSKSAKEALKAAKKAWKGLNEEQKTALGQYGDTSILKTQDARTIANGVRMLLEWDARRARISEAVKAQIKKTPNEGQMKILTCSPKYYISEVTGDVTSPFAYAVDKGLPIPRKSDFGWDAWENLTDGMKYAEKRRLEKIIGGEHPKRGGMDTVLSDYAQWLGITWDEGAREFEHGRGIEDFLDDILKERDKFEQWKAGDRMTRAQKEAEAAKAKQNGMTDDEFAEEDAWVKAAEKNRIERERMGETEDLSDMPDFSRASFPNGRQYVMVTNYFEAKPQRAVRFDEMKAWIVPDTITPENRKILEGNGQRIYTYKAGDEADRLRVVNEVANENELKFSRGGRAQFVAGRTRVATDAEHGELSPGGLASAKELAAVRNTPVSALGTRRFLSLPISDLEELRKMVSGDIRPAYVKKSLPDDLAATSTKKGKVAILADTIGVVDRTDMEKEKATLKAHGFFRNEDPSWCLGQSAAAVKAERIRSDEQLSRQLEALGDRRMKGLEAGGQTAERGVFADEVAKVVMAQERHVGGRLGRLQTIGKTVQNAVAAMPGMNAADAEWSARQFLDWSYGQPNYSQNMSGKDLTAEMFGKWLVMPQEVEARAPEWALAIEGTIAADRQLSDSFRTLADRRLNGDEYLFKRLRKQLDRQTESALMKLNREANEPINAGSNWNGLKESFLYGLHDTFAPVYVRMDTATKTKIKAMKAALRAAPQAARPALKQQIDLYLGDLGDRLNRLELARTAYERGGLNEASVYYREMVRLENEATERWGLTTEDMSFYLDQMRVIETNGRSAANGEDVYQAHDALLEMQNRLGPEKWRRMQQYGNTFHAIHEQELLNDPRAEKMFGKAYIDYLKTQTHYVTTKRVHSQEELDAIDAARANARRVGVSGGDDVIGQMYAYGGAKGAGRSIGEADWTAKQFGSMAAKRDARGATFEKVDRLQRALRRNQLVLDLREALTFADVKGVKDMPRIDGMQYPEGSRYGHLKYIENGQKRTLVVPRQIADAFNGNGNSANWYSKTARTIHNVWRSLIIDYNPAYWPMNVRRNQDSIEKNMPGMRETYVKTALRALHPGLGTMSDLVFQTVVRNIPTSARLFNDKTVFAYIPQMERICKIVERPGDWQQEYWKAEDDGDTAKLAQMDADWNMCREMMKANMFVSLGSVYRGEIAQTFAADALAKKGLKTIDELKRERASKSGTRKFVEAINFLKKNQAQQEHEDILAKGIAYLADRKHYGLVRTSQESGDLVNSRVSIAQGERRGAAAKTMKMMVPFFNMIEKGVVRHWDAYRTDPGHTLGADAKFFLGRASGLLMATGLAQMWMLKNSDGDEEKAKQKFGKFYDYAKDYHDAYRNCSEYVRKNYNFTPIWTQGYTSVIIGGALTDEEKLISPMVDFTVNTMAASEGLTQQPSFGSTILDSTVRAVVPDLQITGPIIEGLRLAVVAATGENTPDYFFNNAPVFDQKTLDMRYDSLEDFGEFSAAVGSRLWNYGGGRSVISMDVNGVDNGRGEAPETLENVLRKIPWVSPAINRMVKIQVGSPEKDAKNIRANGRQINQVIDKCAARLLDKSEGQYGYHETNPEAYEQKIAEFAKTYGLDEYDQAVLRKKYLNGWIQRRCRESFDQRLLLKTMQKGRRRGMSETEIWIQLGER